MKKRTALLSAYFTLTAVFFVVYLFTDMIKSPYHILYIVLNFVFATLLSRGRKPLLLVAMAMTIIADWLLVNNNLILGVLCFICVQLCYFFIQNPNPRTAIVPFCIWADVSVSTALILMGSIPVTTGLLFVVCFYGFISIINNILFKRNFLSVGILLLFICDIFILLSWCNLVSGFNYPWLFYIPSQAFVVLYSTDFG
jgi:hypothetical protein